MTYSYFHPEEEHQVWALENYAYNRPGARLLVEFADGESYGCVFDTAYDSDNAGEFDIEIDHPMYDEFHQVCLEIIETVVPGLRPYGEWLNLDYRDFPIRITDIDTDTDVYPAAEHT